MRINNIQANTNNKNNVSHKGGREIVRTLANPDALASTVLLESAVTGGRGYNAYKRGGINELRERATDDILAAVFWMKGVDIFNKLGDKFGEKVLKLPTTEFDVGRDALRTPFQNRVADLHKLNVKPEDVAKVEKKLASFKFTKIIAATLLSTAFVGFALPKINQGITRMFMSKEKKQQEAARKAQDKNNNQDKLITKEMATVAMANAVTVSFEEFNKRIAGKEKPSFKGLLSPEMMTTIVHYLENNKVCKLLSSDVGITTGRVASARNKDEGLEYLFRDVASSFFYIASTPVIYSGLQKATGSKGYTSIDPVAAKQVHEKLVEQLGEKGSMGVKEFAAKTIGTLDDAAKELMSKLPFNSDVISLSELGKHLPDEELMKKAAEMAKLQPMQAGVGAVLTKQQVADVLNKGSISDPKFMQKLFGSKFGDSLTNPYKYIPMKKITSFRDDIGNYAQSVIDIAKKKNNGIVDKKLLNSINKKGFIMSAGFRAVAIGISALALGVVIPKVQYAITRHRTGSSAAPGLREFEEQQQTEVKSTTA